MIRIALDLFLLEQEQYQAVLRALGGLCETVQARGMLWPGPWAEIEDGGRLIRDLPDPDEIEERERHERWMAHDEYRAEYEESQRRREWHDLKLARQRAEAGRMDAADVTFFWLPNTTDNRENDPYGRHWYPFASLPPERQQWIVWDEIIQANLAWLSRTTEWQPLSHWPTIPTNDVRILDYPANTPEEGAIDAFAFVLEWYRAMPYAQYLDTPHWRRTRDAAIQEAGYSCAECGLFMHRLEVHHLTYERRGAELPDDLQVLCHECHAKAHGRSPDGDL